MINLSKKAADRFNYNWSELVEQHGDCWKIDIIMLGRFPFIYIVHEYTLFTLFRRKADFKTIGDVLQELQLSCPWYKNPGQLVVGKNVDKRLNGSINEMKLYASTYYSSHFTEGIEDHVNSCLLSALSSKKYGYGTPLEALKMYQRGEWPKSAL